MKLSVFLQFLLSTASLAQTPTTTDVLPPLSMEGASRLLLGATVEFTSARGNQLRWKNERDGTMLATSLKAMNPSRPAARSDPAFKWRRAISRAARMTRR